MKNSTESSNTRRVKHRPKFRPFVRELPAHTIALDADGSLVVLMYSHEQNYKCIISREDLNRLVTNGGLVNIDGTSTESTE